MSNNFDIIKRCTGSLGEIRYSLGTVLKCRSCGATHSHSPNRAHKACGAILDETKEACVLCGQTTESTVNIEFRVRRMCERCCNTIMLQQATFHVNKRDGS